MAQKATNTFRPALQRSAPPLNWLRIALSGLLAGVALTIMNALKGVAVPAFNTEWTAAMAQLGIHMNPAQANPTNLGFFVATSAAYGIVMVWTYAAVKAQFGAGLRTAALAGVAVWLVGYTLPMVGYSGLGIFPMTLVAMSSALALVEFVVATLIGAWSFRS